VFHSQVHRSLWLGLAAAAVLTAAGCSKTATDEASNTAKEAGPAKPAAAAKPAAVAKPAEPTTMITLPKGTAISAAARQTLATDKNKVGDTFAASLSEPIQVDGKTVIPKGAHVTGRVVTAKKKSPPELTVALASVEVNGKSYKLPTEPINRAPKTQAKNDSGDAEAAKAEKDISLPAQTRLKFMLAKPVKIPVKS
jgi:hypothetical protein